MRRHRLSRLALACSLAVVLALPVFAEPTKIKVDGAVIKGYITHLSSDASQGRRTLTPGYEKAADWAAAKFKEWGLEPAGENGTYFQNVPISGARSAYVWATGVPTLVVNGRPFYHREGSFSVDAASKPGAKVTGDVVFVGYGISAPAKGLDEYAGVDVKGKIVLALKGSPTTAPTPRVQFAPAPAPEAPRMAGQPGSVARGDDRQGQGDDRLREGRRRRDALQPRRGACRRDVRHGRDGRARRGDGSGGVHATVRLRVERGRRRVPLDHVARPAGDAAGIRRAVRRHARRHQAQEGPLVGHRGDGRPQGLRHGHALR